ncbi:hypothetical protein GBA52_028762 [Prunus armeniaca]|nr:hypothetical protein GBA52_028762 [Prunus armeniaca]
MDLQPPKAAKEGRAPLILDLGNKLSRQGLIPALPSLLRVHPVLLSPALPVFLRLEFITCIRRDLKSKTKGRGRGK